MEEWPWLDLLHLFFQNSFLNMVCCYG